MAKTFANAHNAEKAAKRALGADALKGVHFYICRAGLDFTWSPLQPVEERRLSPRNRAALEAAKKGRLPTPPDFSAETHRPWRGKLKELVALVRAGEIEELQAFPINPTTTSPRALERYRAMAVVALEARERRSVKRTEALEARAS